MKADVLVMTENNHIDVQHSQPVVILTPLNNMYPSGSEPSTPTSSINTYVLSSKFAIIT